MQDCVSLTQTLQDITRDYQHDYCVSRTHFVLPCIQFSGINVVLINKTLLHTPVIRYIQKKKDAHSETKVVDCTLSYLGIPKPRWADKNCLSIPLMTQKIKASNILQTRIQLLR